MSTPDRNPQAQQMADESMVRNLRAQIEAIWPQERAIVERHALPEGARVLDVGCGTGEFAAKLLAIRPDLTLHGIDVDPAHLDKARHNLAFAGGRADFAVGDAFHLGEVDGGFDLVVCRHVVQAVPEVPRLLAELVRACKPGGVVHVVAEDYGLMTFHPTRLDADEFWVKGALAYGRAVGCDLHIGRKAPYLLAEAGLHDVRCDLVHVDTLRVARETFAAIWSAWRDGYTDVLAEKSQLSRARIVEHWEDMLACIRDGYASWILPVVSGRKPGPPPPVADESELLPVV
jgi:SAM-dependent methyltransferase